MLNVRVTKAFPAPRRRGARAAGDEGRGQFRLDVEFAAPPGVTILFGASGSGKTLTLKSVAGLVRPEAGLISAGGRTLYDSARGVFLPARERGVGYVFQNLALFPHLTARENVEFAVAGVKRREREVRAGLLLERFGIGHAAGRLPRDISGGEAQRVALARALAARPRVLLLDEPLSALDEATKLGIISDLKEFNRELRLPILYVTHSRDEALSLGESALVFEAGRVVAAGPPADVFDAPVRASVARLTGVENVFEGVVAERGEAAGTMLVTITGENGEACRVEVPLGARAAGERVCLAVRSGELLLAAAEPRGLSARNVLRGRVRAVEQRGGELLVRVSCGVEWVASVTRQSAAEMKLEAGKDVWLIFKTYSCRVLDTC